MVLIGLPKSPIQIENPLTSFLFKSLTVKTVHGRLIWHTWEECERLISEKKVRELKFAIFALQNGKSWFPFAG